MKTISVAVLLVVGATSSARADRDADPARNAFRRGVRSFKTGAYDEALAAFKASLGHRRRSTVLLNVARCYEHLARLGRALRYYEQVAPAWQDEGRTPSKAVTDEVADRMRVLQKPVALYRRGLEDFTAGEYTAAVGAFIGAASHAPWPLVDLHIARTYARLGKASRARTHAATSKTHFAGYVQRWRVRHPKTDPPDYPEIKRWLAELDRLTQSGAVAAHPAPSSVAEGVDRGPWVSLAVGAAGLAVASEILALLSLAKGAGLAPDDEDRKTYRALTAAGHITAGALAATAIAFVIVHFRGASDGVESASRVAIIPRPGGVVVGWGSHF